ncbi:hypothetical protein TNCV_3434631 [Trichonephila clavipes]|nr:hypothetical protein TNCV_3434631 [Trichonephila clavipes]
MLTVFCYIPHCTVRFAASSQRRRQYTPNDESSRLPGYRMPSFRDSTVSSTRHAKLQIAENIFLSRKITKTAVTRYSE